MQEQPKKPEVEAPREIVIPKAAEIARLPDPLDAFQQAKKDDLIIPRRKLVQGVSRKADTSKAGEFWDDVTDDYKPHILVSLISMKRNRTLFQDENLDAGPTCSSDDAIRPRRTVTLANGDTGPTCEGCYYSEWENASDGKGPACQFSYLLLCYDLDDSEMFLLRVGGASRGAWKQYLTKGQRAGTPAYAVGTIIGSEKRTFSRGTAYVLTFKSTGLLPEETVEFMREKAMMYQAVAITEEEDEVPLAGEPFE